MFTKKQTGPNPQNKELTIKALQMLTNEVELVEGTEILGGWVAWNALRNNIEDKEDNSELYPQWV
jgi:hypothetical protein